MPSNSTAPVTAQSSGIVLNIVLLLLACLVSTIVIELFFAVVFKVRRRNLIIVVLAQIVTNPIIVLASNLIYCITRADNINFFIILIALEPVAFLVEGAMYKYFFENYKFMDPFLLSFLLNLISFTTGFVVFLISM